MRCEQNGINARWNGTHTYPGDTFKCPNCGTMVLNTGNTTAYENRHHNEQDIYMTESYRHYTTSKTLKLRQ